MSSLAVLMVATGLVGVAARPASATQTPLSAGGSVKEAWLTGANPGDAVTLRHSGKVVGTGVADALGSLIIRNLNSGARYQWSDTTTGQTSGIFSVRSTKVQPSVNSPLYTGQAMHSGLNYLTMRDGIKLAATVRFPVGVTCTATAPCPTVIEYSGYGTAGPTDPEPFLVAQATGSTCTNCGDPHLLPDSATDVGAVMARVAGFATVSLQMRGTGCSGGAYDLFGYPSDYDAYDAIEIVAHQAWVVNHQVGMVGISYSGLSQFPSAGTDPPGLAAIASMSPTDDLFSTGYPGGIYNNGFAASWIGQRIDDAKPAAGYGNGALVPLATTPVSGVGQPWTYYEIDAELAATGSSTCLANQALHPESESLDSLVGPDQVAPFTGPGRTAALFDRRSMRVWATHITVPVFVSGVLEDEQTGPQWPALLDAIPASTPVFATMVNGGHIDSTDPQTLARWLEFLDIYVAHKVPTQPTGLPSLILGSFTDFASNISGFAALPNLRFTTASSPTVAQADFAAQTPRVHVLFDSGAAPAGAGYPVSTYSADFAAWPPAGTINHLLLGPSGTLSGTSSTPQSGEAVVLDPSVRPATDLNPGSNVWSAAPSWNWTKVPSGYGLGFHTAPFTTATTLVGPATLNLWVASFASALDIQATVTEVRPGSSQEEYVTSGFLRTTNQDDLTDSTALFTDPTYLNNQLSVLSPTAYNLVRIPIDPIAHTFRAGTELRVVITAPGGDRPAWAFDTIDHGQEMVVGTGGDVQSSLVVNQVAGVSATSTLPACGTLRGMPCRTFVAARNGG